MHRWMMFMLVLGALSASSRAGVSTLLEEAERAEARLEPARALQLLLAADSAQPDDVRILQRIARQYSDLVVEARDDAEKRRLARLALEYAERAVALAPDDPVGVLSVAISRGKLGLSSDTRTKVKYSRDVHELSMRALTLDPDYAWAHHVLGRWHLEVAAIGATARTWVKLFHGGLPPASITVATTHLERAVALEPGELAHHLELGFAYAAARRGSDARAAWERGLALPSRTKHDEPAKRRAREALAALNP